MNEVYPVLQRWFLEQERCLATEDGCGEETCPICIFRGIV